MADLPLGPYADWTATPLTGDASSRRYARLTGPEGQTAILMDASAEGDAPFRAFQTIAAHLTGLALAAPRILFADDVARLMVTEDLGQRQYAEWLAVFPADAERLYLAAIDVLARLQSATPPAGLVALTPTRAAGMIAPLFEWHAPHAGAAMVAAITGTLQQVLTIHAPEADVLALRDYHAENLIWRNDRTGTDRVGLLDFQDAVLAPPEYDLVSLLRDARRDVDAALRQRTIAYFASATGRDPDKVAAAAAALGVQRNLRILGIFARLARKDGKARYLQFMPRVWSHIAQDLDHPALADLRPLILQAVPPPEVGVMAGQST